MALGEGFWERVDVRGPDECWNWLGALKDNGYGQLTRLGVSKKPLKAHRVAWVLAYGPIPAGSGVHGTCVLHHCDNRRCVNPSHLFLGTNHDNVRDMHAKGRAKNPIADANRQKTHCRNGHPYSGDNLIVVGHSRTCRECGRLSGRLHMRRVKAAQRALRASKGTHAQA